MVPQILHILPAKTSGQIRVGTLAELAWSMESDENPDCTERCQYPAHSIEELPGESALMSVGFFDVKSGLACQSGHTDLI